METPRDCLAGPPTAAIQTLRIDPRGRRYDICLIVATGHALPVPGVLRRKDGMAGWQDRDRWQSELRLRSDYDDEQRWPCCLEENPPEMVSNSVRAPGCGFSRLPAGKMRNGKLAPPTQTHIKTQWFRLRLTYVCMYVGCVCARVYVRGVCTHNGTISLPTSASWGPFLLSYFLSFCFTWARYTSSLNGGEK